MVFAYSVVHGPAKRLQTWIQKQDGDFNKKAKGCGDHAYLGPTTMSQFVAFKNKELRDDIIYRLSDAAEADGTLWLGLWPKVPVDRVGETRALIVTLVVSLLCQWDMRIGDSMSTFPLLLLLCVEQPPDVDDQRRRSIAAELQSTPDEKLIGLFDDIAIKMKSRYQAQFQVMNDTGCCPRDLYLALLLFRWALVSNTQRVEGSNSTLQSICKAAPAIHLPLASDRLSLKLGPTLSADECCALHGGAVVRARTRSSARFCSASPVPLMDMMVTPPIEHVDDAPDAAGHAMSAKNIELLCRGIQSQLFKCMQIGARHAYTVYLIICELGQDTTRTNNSAASGKH